MFSSGQAEGQDPYQDWDPVPEPDVLLAISNDDDGIQCSERQSGLVHFKVVIQYLRHLSSDQAGLWQACIS